MIARFLCRAGLHRWAAHQFDAAEWFACDRCPQTKAAHS